MKIAIKKMSTGEVITNSMNDNCKTIILELHFSTGYTQAVVQEIRGGKSYLRDLFLQPYGNGHFNKTMTEDDDYAEWVTEMEPVPYKFVCKACKTDQIARDYVVSNDICQGCYRESQELLSEAAHTQEPSKDGE